MVAPDLDRLYMVRSELNRVARSVRILRQQVARIIEAAEDTNDSPKEGTRENERGNRD